MGHLACLVATEIWNWCLALVYPPGYRIMHDIPNKPLTGYWICKILKTNRTICKIFKTMELLFIWSFGETQA